MKFQIFDGITNQKDIDAVNEFIKDKRVLDYKFSTNYVTREYNSNGVAIKGCFYHSILIEYEDDDDDNNCEYIVFK